MPLFDPIDDEIDISEQEETVEETTNLPDEVEVDTNETDEPVEGETDTEETQEEEETTEETQPEEESSLTSEPEAQPGEEPQEEPEPEAPVLSDEDIFATLSEKLGREVKSYEDLAVEQEDPFDGDEELKAIAEWKKKTGRPVSDYAKYQRDYESMSNEDVVREYLQHQYPDFTPEEIALEMDDYVANDDVDMDEDVARKNLRLKKMAITARKELNQYKSTFDAPVEAKLSKEQQEAVNFYKEYQEQSANSQKVMEQYTAGITAESSNLKSIPLQLSDDMSIDLTLSDSEAKELPKLIAETPHWFNEDGSYNHKAIVEDAVKMRNFDKAVKLAYEQGVSKGLETDDAESRNVTFDKPRPSNEGGGKEDIVIEGADNMNMGGGLRFRTR